MCTPVGLQVGFAWARVGRWFSSPSGPPLAPPPRSVRERRARAAADDADDRGTYTLLHALAPYSRQQRQSQSPPLSLEKISPAVARGFFEVDRVGRTEPTAAAVVEEEADGATSSDEKSTLEATLVYRGPPDLQSALTGVVTRLARHFAPTARVRVLTGDAGTAPLAKQPAQATVPESAIKATNPSRSLSSSPPSDVAVGSQPVELLGSALASGDFDGDGLLDLAIGVPGAGARAQCPRCGAVRLNWGNGTTTKLRGGDSRSGSIHSSSSGSSDSDSRGGSNDDGGLLGGVSGVMARFGASLAVLDFNLDGIDDLAVGAPGESGWSTSDPAASPYPFDGEPTFRQWGRVHVFLGSRGGVGGGGGGGGGVGGGGAASAAHDDGPGGLSVARRVVLTTSTPFTGLGYTLATGDVDNDGHADLLIGCPSAAHYGGRLLAVASSAARLPGGSALDVDTDGVAALDITGPQPRGEGAAYGWFGASAAVVVPPTPAAAGGRGMGARSNAATAQLPLLLVGEPYHRANATSCTSDCTIVGRIHAFSLAALPPPSLSPSPPPTRHLNASAAIFTITGSDPLGRLGAVLAATSDGRRVAMAAPDAPGIGGTPLRAGVVAVADVASLSPLTGVVPFDALPSKGIAALIHGTDAQARFGSSVRWMAPPSLKRASSIPAAAASAVAPNQAVAAALPSANESLVVSAPFHSESRLRFDQRELGAIFAWDAAALPPAGAANATSASATAQAVGTRPRGRFGAAVCACAAAGASNASLVLAVGAPRAGVAGTEQAGAVALVAF